MPFPGLITHDRDTDIHSLVASVQKLLYPGCYLLFCFFPHFVLLMAVKSKFKGDSHFPKLRFFFFSRFLFLIKICFPLWIGWKLRKQSLAAKNRVSANHFTPSGLACLYDPFQSSPASKFLSGSRLGLLRPTLEVCGRCSRSWRREAGVYCLGRPWQPPQSKEQD